MEILKLSLALSGGRTMESVISAVRDGSIIVYPTDTIYGIGCNAGMEDAVRKLRQAKGRDGQKPFSVIAPGKDWIWKAARLSPANRDLLDRMLPGPYTVIVRAADAAPRAVVSSEGTLGIRLPKHPFARIVEEAGVPLVTTSVNLSGERPVSRIADIPQEMKPAVDLAIDAGPLEGHASRIFDFTSDDIKAVRR